MQPYVLQKRLEFPTASESRLSKTTGTIQMWIQSETSEIHFTSFVLASTDFAGAITSKHPSTIAEELLWKLLQWLHRKMREGKPLCAHSLFSSYCSMMFGIHIAYILHQGTSWNYHQVVGLLDHFRKREGVQPREEEQRQHLYEGRPHHIAAFLVGWSFLIEFKGLALAISLKMQKLCPSLFPSCTGYHFCCAIMSPSWHPICQ